MKNTLSCPQFRSQNAENCIIFRAFNFLNFLGKHVNPPPSPPPRIQGLTSPFCYSQFLYSNLLATAIFIETHVCTNELLE